MQYDSILVKMYVTILLLVILNLINLSQLQDQLCTTGAIRLEDGPTQFEGRVEVCMNEQWRTVCNDFWGHNEALVVCRQLGYSVSGTEHFIDLRITGGPDTGIDDSNCTGTEERFVDCNFSITVGDCRNEEHKVGVRCHEERVPRNIILTIDGRTLKIAWESPNEGTTNEQIQGYQIECSIWKNGGEVYTLKKIISNESLETFLPTIATTASYNCCVEAQFETYSSRACSGNITLENELQVMSPAPIDIPQDLSQNKTCNHSIAIVAGVLGCVIVILILLLLIAIIVLVYVGSKFNSSKGNDFLRPGLREVASDITVERVLDNPTYGEGEIHNLNVDSTYAVLT